MFQAWRIRSRNGAGAEAISVRSLTPVLWLHRSKAAFLTGLIVLLGPAPSSAQAITFEFRGVVTDVLNDFNNTLAGRVSRGNNCVGLYQFDPTTIDSDSDSVVGMYQMGPPSGLSISLGSLPALARFDGLRIRVRNDIGGVEDDYEVILQPAAAETSEIRIFFRTRDLSRVGSDALPNVPLDVDDFSDVHPPSIQVEFAGGLEVLCDVQSLMISSPPRSAESCAAPDPFGALGGGTCCNGGWLPPGMVCATTPVPPPPPPPPANGTCTSLDPFVALGGGTCCNGGWLPLGMVCATTPPPPPPPPSLPPNGACTTSDPFVALGGGTCCNTGWLPPGMVCATTPSQPPPQPPPAGGACMTSDPFVALGGGTCCNTGWLPPGMVCATTPSQPPPQSPPAAVLDQSFSVPSQIQGYGLGSVSGTAQTFTVGVAGVLTAVDLLLVNHEVSGHVSGPVTVKIFNTVSGVPNTMLDEVTLDPGTAPAVQLTFKHFSGFSIPVKQGDVLAIVVFGQETAQWSWQGGRDSSATYPGGRAYNWSGSGWVFATPDFLQVDLGFRTYVTPGQ
jgi:hypothetical protein